MKILIELQFAAAKVGATERSDPKFERPTARAVGRCPETRTRSSPPSPSPKDRVRGEAGFPQGRLRTLLRCCMPQRSDILAQAILAHLLPKSGNNLAALDIIDGWAASIAAGREHDMQFCLTGLWQRAMLARGRKQSALSKETAFSGQSELSSDSETGRSFGWTLALCLTATLASLAVVGAAAAGDDQPAYRSVMMS